jgi:hypothetical protein
LAILLFPFKARNLWQMHFVVPFQCFQDDYRIS